MATNTTNIDKNISFIQQIRKNPEAQPPGHNDLDDYKEFQNWQEYDNWRNNPHRNDQEYDENNNEHKDQPEPTTTDPEYDPYDQYLQHNWTTEGGYTESIHQLYKKIRNKTITLTEALTWVKQLNWPQEHQQTLTIQYISHTLTE
jgi:hypothetical protein